MMTAWQETILDYKFTAVRQKHTPRLPIQAIPSRDEQNLWHHKEKQCLQAHIQSKTLCQMYKPTGTFPRQGQQRGVE